MTDSQEVASARDWLNDIGRATLHGAPPMSTFMDAMKHIAMLLSEVDKLAALNADLTADADVASHWRSRADRAEARYGVEREARELAEAKAAEHRDTLAQTMIGMGEEQTRLMSALQDARDQARKLRGERDEARERSDYHLKLYTVAYERLDAAVDRADMTEKEKEEFKKDAKSKVKEVSREIPKLKEEMERLEAQVARLARVAQHVTDLIDGGSDCPMCSVTVGEDGAEVHEDFCGLSRLQPQDLVVGKEDEPLFYVQDTRGYVGNCVLWWAKNSQGYTAHLHRAGLYTKGQCESMRDTDVPWPRELVLKSASSMVDIQILRRMKDEWDG